MTDLLLAGLERLPARVRTFVVAAGALLTFGAVIAALTLPAPHGGHKRRPAPQRTAATTSVRTHPHRLPAPVSRAAMLQVRRVAQRFLASYLPFASGRSRAIAITGVTRTLRRQILRRRAHLTPVDRHRLPRVVSLGTVGTAPAFAVATAMIDDGGVATYRLRFTLERGVGGWAVSSVEDG
jgi:hypothetical protein